MPLRIFIYFIKKQNIVYILIYLSFLLLLILFYFFHIKNLIKCDDWPKGLNNSYIENNITKYGCQIKFPKSCPYKIGKFFLDLTKWKGINCNKRSKNERNILLKFSKSPYINNNTLRIGYPMTNIKPICCLKSFNRIKDYNSFPDYISHNLLDVDNKELMKKIKKENLPEIQVDFSKNYYGKMIIDLNYNEILSGNRKKLEKNSDPYSNNLLLIYIDSVSRANSIRQLKKTLKFFEKFMSYNSSSYKNNFSSQYFHSFQFFKYHAFNGYTPNNYPILFYGQKRGKHIVRITKYLKQNGYITGIASDFCFRDNTRTFHKMTISEVYDHQMLICDPNEVHYNNMIKRCLYGKINSEHLYIYANQFWRKYKKNRKFFNVLTNDGHEGTLQTIKYNDEIIFNFLNNLYKDNLLKDSSIFLLSDHGVGMPSLYYLYDFYKIEYYFPMFYIIVNDRKNKSYIEQYKYIHKNQQTFITSFDIYNTIGHLIYGDDYLFIKNKKIYNDTPKSIFGTSLFLEIDQKIRSPRKYSNMNKNRCK